MCIDNINLLLPQLNGSFTREWQTLGYTQAVLGEASSRNATLLAGGGLLAAGPNLGRFERDAFSVAPEFTLNVGYSVTPNVRLFAGPADADAAAPTAGGARSRDSQLTCLLPGE